MKALNVIKKEITNVKLESISKFNKENKKEIEKSLFVGCYYCCNIFAASNVKEWVRSYRKKGEESDCALCPVCGIDSVLPDTKVPLTIDTLNEMHDYYFSE